MVEEAGVSFTSETSPLLHVNYMGHGWTCSSAPSHCGLSCLALQVTVVFPVFPGYP